MCCGFLSAQAVNLVVKVGYDHHIRRISAAGSDDTVLFSPADNVALYHGKHLVGIKDGLFDAAGSEGCRETFDHLTRSARIAETQVDPVLVRTEQAVEDVDGVCDGVVAVRRRQNPFGVFFCLRMEPVFLQG